jgi:hypothetical protein
VTYFRVQIFFVFLYTTHAVDENSFCFERNDTPFVVVVESETKCGVTRREFGGDAVEEEVVLVMGYDVEWREQSGDVAMSFGVCET